MWDPSAGTRIRIQASSLWLLIGSLFACAVPAWAQDGGAAAEVLAAGEAVYARECLSCHMRDGRGVPGMSPPLLNSPWVAGDADALIGFVLTGGFGPQVLMARFDYISDADMAALLTYVRAKFGSDTTLVTPERVAAARATFGQAAAAAPPK